MTQSIENVQVSKILRFLLRYLHLYHVAIGFKELPSLPFLHFGEWCLENLLLLDLNGSSNRKLNQ